MFRVISNGVVIECATADGAVAVAKGLASEATRSLQVAKPPLESEVGLKAEPKAKTVPRTEDEFTTPDLIVSFARELKLVDRIKTTRLFRHLGGTGARTFAVIERTMNQACLRMGYQEGEVFERDRDGTDRIFKAGPKIAEFLSRAERELAASVSQT